MMGCKCLYCEAEQAEAPVITVDVTPLLESPAFLDPAIPRTLTGLRVDRELPAGDELAAIVKDVAGQVLGYIAQSEAIRAAALPAADAMRAAAEAIHELVWAGNAYMQNISLPTMTLPKPTPLWDQVMGEFTESLSRHVEAGLINAYSFGRGAEPAGPVLVDEMPVESISAVALLREHNRRQGVWAAGPR